MKRRRGDTVRVISPASNKRSTNWKQIGLWAGGIVVVVGLTAVVVAGGGGSASSERPEPPAGTEIIEAEAPQHVSGAIDQGETPPVGGAHSSLTLGCGFYDAPVPAERAVHSLEHGVVWVTYQDSISADEMDTLRGIARQRETIVSPFPGQPAPVMATAWERQIELAGADDPRLQQFIDAFRDAPSSPEPFATC